jgi:hypothetical protein
LISFKTWRLSGWKNKIAPSIVRNYSMKTKIETTRIYVREAETNGTRRSPRTLIRTRLTLSLGFSCRWGEDEIKKIVIG